MKSVNSGSAGRSERSNWFNILSWRTGQATKSSIHIQFFPMPPFLLTGIWGHWRFPFIVSRIGTPPLNGTEVKNPSAMQEMQGIRVQSLGQKIPCRKIWQPTPVFLPGKSHEQGILVDLAHTHCSSPACCGWRFMWEKEEIKDMVSTQEDLLSSF